MKTTRSSILLYSGDTALRERVKELLEAEIDVSVEERHEVVGLGDLEDVEIAAAIVDTGFEAELSRSIFEHLPARLPLLTLCSGPAPDWLTEDRPEGEVLQRDAPVEHIVHALRLSLLRTINLSPEAEGDADAAPRKVAPDVVTRSVLGDLRAEFRRDLATTLRDVEELVRAHDESSQSGHSVDSERILPDEEAAPRTGGSIKPPGSARPVELFIEDVRTIRKLSDTLDLVEFAPLLFALEVTLRDLPTPDGRSRLRDILRQLRNVAAGRPTSAGFDGGRLRVAHIGGDPEECHDFGLEDPDRLDVRHFKHMRMFARQIDLFRPDVIALRIRSQADTRSLNALREIRGGTRETIIVLSDPDISFDPIDLLRFPRFAHFETPFAWNEIATRVFQLEGEFSEPSRVLVIHEDEEAVRQVERCLDPESFFVQSISSAADLIEKVIDLAPDCIFIGEELELVSGFDVCREVRAELPLARIPLVMLTNDGDRALREQAFRVGADDYLELPLIGDEVRRRARILIEHRRLRFATTARDPLTGLDNACTLVDTLHDVLRSAAQAEEWTSLLVLDIDRFEMIRNFYGQASADTIVRSVADALRKIFSHDDLIFRGTDEFYVVRRRALDSEAERAPVLDGIADIGRLTFRSADGRGFYATVTGGHILIPPGHLRVESCVRRALRVLAAANRTARGTVLTAEIDPEFDESEKD